MADELISPLGTPYRDVDPLFTFLRGNFAEAIDNCTSYLQMLRFLHMFNEGKSNGNITMHSNAKESELAREFAMLPVDSEKYWERAFQIIKYSKKFNETVKMKEALGLFIADLKIQKQRVSKEKQQDILTRATAALERAFKN